MVITWLAYKLTKFKNKEISFKGRKLRVDVADTFGRQLVGLMYRKSLAADAGMLFVFGRESKWGIWMPNMNFAIDIIWISRNGRIVDIRKGAMPSKSLFSSEVYKPKERAKYVLEVNSNASSRYNMRIGDRIAFNL